jgi:hypothetical protein
MKCNICRDKEATVRDRERPSDRRKTICEDCHRERLVGDFKHILSVERRRNDERKVTN